jgi:hypothetical protein
MGELKAIIKEEFANPSHDLVKLLASRVYDGAMRQAIIDQFAPLVKRSLNSHVSDIIAERLKGALSAEQQEEKKVEEQIEEPVEQVEESRIITTEEELESFMIVKSILRPVVDINRVVYRDTINYFGILLDDNNRKPICRMRFNSQTKKYLVTFDADKKELKHEIKSLDDIYDYAEEIKAAIAMYDAEK